jgi:hypothetical protein
MIVRIKIRTWHSDPGILARQQLIKQKNSNRSSDFNARIRMQGGDLSQALMQ